MVLRYLHLSDHHLVRNGKVDILFGDELDLQDMKFPVKIKSMSKIEKKEFHQN